MKIGPRSNSNTKEGSILCFGERPTNLTSVTNIPMLTELANDYNAQFLDQDDDDDPDDPLYMTQPFACGRAFAASVLDTLMSAAYFNPEAISLIRMLITGGDTSQIEQLMAEGVGFVRGSHSKEDIISIRSRSKVSLLPLKESPLQSFKDGTYGSLFTGALRHHAILCIGLYRLFDPQHTIGANRYILTNPVADTTLYPSDQVYCLEPFRLPPYLTTVSEQPSTEVDEEDFIDIHL